jgi:hypothetical protein
MPEKVDALIVDPKNWTRNSHQLMMVLRRIQDGDKEKTQDEPLPTVRGVIKRWQRQKRD